MSETKVTAMWVAGETARAFIRAMGKHRSVLLDDIDSGALSLWVDILPSDDVGVMARRAARAGRMLADEARRKGLRAFAVLPFYAGGKTTARVSSKDMGMALRLTEQYHPTLGVSVYRVDMLGSRRLGKVAA